MIDTGRSNMAIVRPGKWIKLADVWVNDNSLLNKGTDSQQKSSSTDSKRNVSNEKDNATATNNKNFSWKPIFLLSLRQS